MKRSTDFVVFVAAGTYLMKQTFAIGFMVLVTALILEWINPKRD